MLSSLDSHVQDEFKYISLSHIEVNPYQPRREFNLQELEELAQSIRTVGILHPPLVRPLPHSSSYELISGERRFRAAQLADLTTIPVYIRKTDDFISAQAALIENIQRVDLNPLEIAKALKRLMIEFEFTQERLAEQIGKKRSTIANYLRLLTLPLSIQNSLVKNEMTMGHAKAILGLDQVDQQILLHAILLRDNLTVRATEQVASRMGQKAKKKQPHGISRDVHLEQLVDKIREKLGTQVFIQSKGEGGQIIINYYNLDNLDHLLTLLGIQFNT